MVMKVRPGISEQEDDEEGEGCFTYLPDSGRWLRS